MSRSEKSRVTNKVAALLRQTQPLDGQNAFSILGYSYEEFKAALCATLQEGYCWDDYVIGKLQLDHIIPVPWFKYTSFDSEGFRQCWSLGNFQLIEARTNASKGSQLSIQEDKIFPSAWEDHEFLEPLHRPGVYAIINILNNRFYVGGAVDLKKRLDNHFCRLRLNKHANSKLQASYDKHGRENFVFRVIEYTDRHDLSEREDIWIRKYLLTGQLYNILLFTDRRMKEKHSFYGKTHSEDAKQKLRESRAKQVIVHSEKTKTLIGDKSRGRIQSEESKVRQSIAKMGIKQSEAHASKSRELVKRLAEQKTIRFHGEQLTSLLEAYAAGKSVVALAKVHKVSQNVIVRALNENGVKVRSLSEQMKITNKRANKCKKNA